MPSDQPIDLSTLRVVLDKSLLRIQLRADAAALTAELSSDGAAAPTAIPLLGLGGEPSGSTDLKALSPERIYTIAIRTPGGPPQNPGPPVARQYRLLQAGQAKRSASAAARKLATSSFETADGRVHASLFLHGSPASLSLRLSRTDDIDAFLAGLSTRTAAAPHVRFSVVTSVYNVAKYLDEFFQSITSQTLDFTSSVDLIMVDDGSTDASARLIRRWQAKYPKNIRYVRKANGGPASARNFGLKRARHDWVTFIDPDDFVSTDYFEEVAAAIRENPGACMVACNVIHYLEDSRTFADTNMLRFKFAAGTTAVPVAELGNNIQLMVNSAFFLRERIGALEFETGIRPTFEDAHFVGRYLIRSEDMQAVFCRDAKYFYRQRADNSSLLQVSQSDPDRYTTMVTRGYIDLLAHAAKLRGTVPNYIQHTVFYDLLWQLAPLIDKPAPAYLADPAHRQTYLANLKALFAHIDADTVHAQEIVALPFFVRLGIVSLFKGEGRRCRVEVTGFDPTAGLAQVVSWSQSSDTPLRVEVDGNVIEPTRQTSWKHDFLGEAFIWEHVAWLPLGEHGLLRIALGGEPAEIRAGGRAFGQAAQLSDVRAACARRPVVYDEAARNGMPSDRLAAH